MMEYKVVLTTQYSTRDKALRELEEEVNKLIKQGWKPQGGISLAVLKGFWVTQAMIRE